ncbi:hypothetical protein [Roseivirga sp. E12]|uniref:hypothetical protein n=1 Tax=Roseivirga sp. E12 TaxID=2819237 RepID=UPI001ABC7F1D|nr:hypothetical protein [Roseivirga sp. E12]MBO3698250.1 hypothetical protein [Roseivirga sp. E12]
MASKLYNLRFVASLLWLGFVLAISFMEAPLKFQAPSVSLQIGLEVGRIVFDALNKVEWVLLILIALSLTVSHHSKKGGVLMLSLLTILLIQTFYLLPILDARAEDIIEGQSVAESNMHFYYVGIEVVKVVLLIVATHHFIKRGSN